MTKNYFKDKYQLLLTVLGLIAIIIFAIFLRSEDFPHWQQKKGTFQYKGEYQMANFDSYHYLQIAKDLKNGDYDSLDEKRRVPNGMKRSVIPPLLSILTVGINKLTGISISLIAIFIPVFLSSLLALLIFIISRKLHLNRIAALTASLFAIISLTYIIRTRIGVFDTDSLNVSFALLNSYLFLQFADIKSNRRYKYLALGFIATFLYFIWWNTAGSVVILSAVVPLSVALIFFYKTKKVILKYCVLSIFILISFYFFSGQILSYFRLLFNQTSDAYFFPSNISITELDAVSLIDFIKGTTGSKLVFSIMLLGLVSFIYKFRLKVLFFAIPILMAVLPFFAGNRFMIFSAPILALGIGYLIQLLFNFKKNIKPLMAYVITAFLIILGIYSNYHTITHKYTKPAGHKNIALLNALEENTPDKYNIWTNWDLGYQTHYYLGKGTFADGEFSDEILLYLSYPLATDNLAVSANFMRFYNKHGVKGMQDLYELFSGVADTFNFLNKVLSLTPTEAEQWLEQQKNMPSKAKNLTTPKQWVSFLFPRQSDDIYLFLHYRMTQTAAWFKQGNSDLKTGKTKGLPLFLALHNLKEQGEIIKNNQITVNSQNGSSNHINGSRHSFQHILTYNGIQPEIKTYPKQAFNRGKKDNRFVFQWNKKIGFGAAMSQEMANTTFVKLYLQQKKSPHFEPVSLNTPYYQIWKIKGSAYENQ